MSKIGHPPRMMLCSLYQLIPITNIFYTNNNQLLSRFQCNLYVMLLFIDFAVMANLFLYVTSSYGVRPALALPQSCDYRQIVGQMTQMTRTNDQMLIQSCRIELIKSLAVSLRTRQHGIFLKDELRNEVVLKRAYENTRIVQRNRQAEVKMGYYIC